MSIANKREATLPLHSREIYFHGQLLEPIKSQLPVAHRLRFMANRTYIQRAFAVKDQLRPVNLSRIAFSQAVIRRSFKNDTERRCKIGENAIEILHIH